MFHSPSAERLAAAHVPDRRYMMLVPLPPDSEILEIELKLLECMKCDEWNECKKRLRLWQRQKKLKIEKSWCELIREVGDR